MQIRPRNNHSATNGWFLALGGLILLIVATLVYSPVYFAQFVWDDEFLVLRNPFIRSPVLGLEVFRHFLFADAKNEFYRPVQIWSYMFDYWRAGLTPFAFHLTNIVIHSLNGLLLFGLLGKLINKIGRVDQLRSSLLAFSIALLWLIHPVHSAIVAYISGRADSLALAGILSAWLLWEKGIGNFKMTRLLQFAGAAFITLLGCCSKEIALIGLGFFAIHIWIFRDDVTFAIKSRTTLALVGIFIIYLTLRNLPNPNETTTHIVGLPWSEKGILFLRAMGDYARLIIYPGKLFMERQVSLPTGLFTDPVKNDPLFPFLGCAGGFFLVILLASLLWKGTGARVRLLGILWFGFFILPVSNLLTLNATVAEHWLYIPSIGIGLWLVGCWLDCGKNLQRVALLLLPICLTLLSWRAYQRAADWRDPISFYMATVRAGGDSIRIRLNLAAEFQKIGNLQEAARILKSILKVMPDYNPAKIALAQNLTKQGRGNEAKSIFSSAQSQAKQSVTELVATIGNLDNKDVSAALSQARDSYKAHPDSWPLAKALARIYQQKNQPRVSLELVKGFVARNWWQAEAQCELAELYLTQGFAENAVQAYLAAARLDIRDSEPLNQAALILAQMGNISEAIDLQKKAVQRNNGDRQKEILNMLQKLASEKLLQN